MQGILRGSCYTTDMIPVVAADCGDELPIDQVVVANSPLQHCMEVGDLAFGLADLEGDSLFQLGGLVIVFSYSLTSLGRSMEGYWREESVR